MILASDVTLSQLFSIGIGPSSSHTVGPMRAVTDFLQQFVIPLQKIDRITIELMGSLALTGRGHGTDRAIMLALLGEKPDSIDPDTIPQKIAALQDKKQLIIGSDTISFDPDNDIIFNFKDEPKGHPNTLIVKAWEDKSVISEQAYYSIGGGFIEREGETTINEPIQKPFPFSSADELLQLCEDNQLSIADITLQNELTAQTETELKQQVKIITDAMSQCIKRGCKQAGLLPGSLNLKRRAPQLYLSLLDNGPLTPINPLRMNWLNVFAMAVNEENAAGARVVTAPTNGAAGIIPAVLEYARLAYDNLAPEHDFDFLLTAAAIGSLYKTNASISGAEVGCQGEVGVACSMAAAGLAAILGGSPLQVENAAEIAMEHNLGLTCDPVGGLVQIPCIERNAMAAVKAVNAAQLAIAEDGSNHVSLDTVIKTMLQVGKNMSHIYKETALGGLASTVNIPEC